MRLITYYSDSHQGMAKKYVEPMAVHFDELITFTAPQTCPSATWMQEGWNEVTAAKLQRLAELPVDDGLDFFTDADVCMKSELRAWLDSIAPVGDFIFYGSDNHQFCTGTLLYRRTKRVQQWWSMTAMMCSILETNDQDGIHAIIANAKRLPLHMESMDKRVVANLATLGSIGPWDDSPFVIPPECLLWHANWTLGVPQKLRMLEIAARQMGGEQ